MDQREETRPVPVDYATPAKRASWSARAFYLLGFTDPNVSPIIKVGRVFFGALALLGLVAGIPAAFIVGTAVFLLTYVKSVF